MKRRIFVAAVAFAGLAAPALVLGQAFPSRPITIIVPFPPGGVTDPVARMVGQRVSENTKQPVVVENKPGASGIIASEYVKKMPADGYTVLMGFTGSHSVNPTLYSKLPYDPVKDFQPVTPLISTKHVLVVPAESPARTVKELVEYAKKKPGGLSYASQGVGAGGHLLGEMFKAQTGTQLEHIAYKGSAPAIQDILANRVDMFYDAIVTALPHIRDGRLRALAVATAERDPRLPNVPTMAEAGFPGIEGDQWFGIFVPAGTPAPVVQKLNEEFVKAVRSPDISKKITDQGLDIFTGTPDEFAAQMRADAAKFGKVVKDGNIRAD